MSSITRPRACTNLLTSAKLQFSTSPISSKSHYDTLGITPKATQSDIKSAYYKLTKIYHPDRNKTEDAKQKFRSITDAYEILGNYKSRRMYDRGMRPGPKHTDNRDQEEIKKDDAQTRFYKSRLYRSQVPVPPGGRNPIYDFDAWAKAHYGDLFNQKLKARATWEREENLRMREEVSGQNLKIVVPIFLVFFLINAVMFSSNTDKDFDKDKLNYNKKDLDGPKDHSSK